MAETGKEKPIKCKGCRGHHPAGFGHETPPTVSCEWNVSLAGSNNNDAQPAENSSFACRRGDAEIARWQPGHTSIAPRIKGSDNDYQYSKPKPKSN
jgi:hypothetical protein